MTWQWLHELDRSEHVLVVNGCVEARWTSFEILSSPSPGRLIRERAAAAIAGAMPVHDPEGVP